MLFPLIGFSQFSADDVLGTWYNAEKTSKIKVYKCGNENKKYCGKLVWLQRETEEDGGPRIDLNNPDRSKQKDLMMNLVILKLFEYDQDDEEWNDGTIYDPENGKTYSCIIKRNGSSLDVRGYVGISLLGRTTVWTKAE